jgi:hypothetical protein
MSAGTLTGPGPHRRDVVVEVLPAGMSQDPERLRRFEQETRLAGSLSHPNVLTRELPPSGSSGRNHDTAHCVGGGRRYHSCN